MKCPKCGWECGQDDKFCRECGSKLHFESTPATGFEHQEGPENSARKSHNHSVDHTLSDDHTHSTDHTLSDDHTHSTDHTLSDDHTHSTDHTLSDDHTRSTDHTLSDDHTHSTDHNLSDDHTDSTDHNLSDDHTRSTDHTHSTDHTLSDDHTHSTDQKLSDDHTLYDDHTHSTDHNLSDDHTHSTDHNLSDDHTDSTDHNLSDDHTRSTDHTHSTDHTLSGDHTHSTDQNLSDDHTRSTDHTLYDDHTHSTDHTLSDDHTHSAKSDIKKDPVDPNNMDWTLRNTSKDAASAAQEKEEHETECSKEPTIFSEDEASSKDPSAPERLEATDVKSRSVTLCWERPVSMEGVPHEIHITYSCEGEEPRLQKCAPNTTTAVLSDLRPGMKYTFSITTVLPNGSCSETRSVCVKTNPSAPERVEPTDVRISSVTLCWERPVSMEGVPHEIHITYSCEGEEPRLQKCFPYITTAVLSDLRPGMKYTFNITTVLPNGSCSETRLVCVNTRSRLEELLCDLGLEHHLQNKLTLSRVLQISGETLTDENIQSLKSLPWCFLRKLMMVNVTARSVNCTTKVDIASEDLVSFLDSQCNPEVRSNELNPLDLITAVLLCSDGFLQQEILLKMSLCQFSVPLLLPNCDTQQCTLMLWAMRDIVKKYKPHSLKDPRGFVEESIVLSQLPMISFVRLGNCSMSKSHILNQVLSNSQQYHDTFVHKNMETGDTRRRISNGLVEISWYLPSGNKKIDIFSEPLAIANLRGDISDFTTQLKFIHCTSAAIFVFCDDFKFEYDILNFQHVQDHWFLITNPDSKHFDRNEFMNFVTVSKQKNIIIKGQRMNEAEFIKNLRSAISDILKGTTVKRNLQDVSAITRVLGIYVDEADSCCQRGKKMADKITGRISDIPSFRNNELPLQDAAWKQLAKLEKEEHRLRKAGDKNIEVYRSELADQKQELRAQQRAHGMSKSMSLFIKALSAPTEERKYFLKWMKINLDNLSRKTLPLLRAEYKELCQKSGENKELIVELDRKMCSCSLGTEHFLREMAQLYESACSDPKGPSPEIKLLPLLCAELLQEGFPLELVDGDASNIPLQWVTQVLKELDHLTQNKCKIRVITVLGVQSTGKSTLLNTMFGVQFAVSSGRCTRGAFMLLIRVKEDFKEQLECDYIMIIDTEGLKSPELAQLDESFEHDNELATLVVGLSDITIINIAMENAAEMKDILQIVVHAFLRMKEVGTKPCCQFVHQNVADISAHDKNMRGRESLLDQLNEMTEAAAKMEKKLNKCRFTDIIEYDPEKNNWYIPGLWHGNPPMAPVNAGYSEAVNQFKMSVIEIFKAKNSGQNTPHTIGEFTGWTKSLWEAVKYENFIFSFRNSLVAEAYTQLCTEFNTWEWDFRKSMYSWLSQAENKVSNLSLEAASDQTFETVNIQLSRLKSDASIELAEGEQLILKNLTEFYQRKNGHVHLVEKFKQDFISTAKSVRNGIENSVTNKLEAAVEVRKGMFRLESIKKNHSATMEQNVLKLVEKCRKSKELTDKQLEAEFERMWADTVAELKSPGLKKGDVVQDIYNQLRANLSREGSSVQKVLSKVGNLSECGTEPFKVKNEGVFKRVWQAVFGDEQRVKTQNMADLIIKHSREFVDEKVGTRSDYHNTYIRELLHMIDGDLERHNDLGLTAKFKAKLKIHICGHAAREFEKMHLNFNRVNDPRHCLEQVKGQYCADFKDLFHEKDQCQKKAVEFTYNCLAPAVREYITKSLGPDLVDEVLTGKKGIDFSTRTFFQFSILKQLLKEDKSKDIVKYIRNYQSFAEEWIFEQMVQQFTEGDGLRKTEIKNLELIVCKLKIAIEKAKQQVCKQATGKAEEDQNIKQFIQYICSDLQEDLIIPQDPLRAVLALNTAKTRDFSQCLTRLVDEMKQSFTAEFQRGGDVRNRLTSLPVKPQKVLFNRVFGCGEQCPFCMTPCEAGGQNHTEHFAAIHRPQGIGGWRCSASQILVSNICTTDVASEKTFRSEKTEQKTHPYKAYRSFYPDWCIQPDTSIQASDYWKYVFARFNKQFAEEYIAKPAEIPHNWTNLKCDQAEKSLMESFQMKGGD